MARLGHSIKSSTVPNSYEQENDLTRAQSAAADLADKFTDVTGVTLKPDNSRSVIFSPKFGWSDNLKVLKKDIHSFFVFSYTATEDDSVTVYICPTLHSYGVWVSLSDLHSKEGMYSPSFKRIIWREDLIDAMFPITSWGDFDLSKLQNNNAENESIRYSLKSRKTESKIARCHIYKRNK